MQEKNRKAWDLLYKCVISVLHSSLDESEEYCLTYGKKCATIEKNDPQGRDKMSTKLKTGITNTSYGVYDFEAAIEKISSHGYDCIDYQGFVNVETDFFNLPVLEFEKELKRQRELIERHGLTVSQAHAPWRHPVQDATPEGRAFWTEAMKKAIYGTHVLGSTRFVVHPLMPYFDTGEGKDEVWSLNETFAAELADYAKQYGVTVCVENLPFPAYPLTTVEQVCELVDKLNRENLKVCLDMGHAAIFYGADVGAAVRYIGKRLEAVHVHDNMGKEDQHLIPGDGIIDWDGVASALKEIAFDGVVSLETSAKNAQHPKEEWDMRERRLANLVRDLADKSV